MALAVAAAGFTPGEADQLRRAIASWKRKLHTIKAFETKLIEGMVENKYPRKFAEQVFEQISGFSGYGFPESHAASFAHLVYASCWLKHHHPAAFAAALINSQPMGFYQPAQIVRDAQAHRVEVRPVNVNHSRWDCTLEAGSSGLAIRLGMRLVDGLAQADADRIADAVQSHGPFSGMDALWRASGVGVKSLRLLAEADAFGSMSLTRQQALWEVQALKGGLAPLFDERPVSEAFSIEHAPPPKLPPVSPQVTVLDDYRSVGLSLKAHPVSFIRDQLAGMGVTINAALADEASCPKGRKITVAGIVLVRQRPSTASGIVFFTIEDETGIANLIVRPHTFDKFRRAARHSRMIACEGTIERAGMVVHVQAKAIRSIDGLSADLAFTSRDFH